MVTCKCSETPLQVFQINVAKVPQHQSTFSLPTYSVQSLLFCFPLSTACSISLTSSCCLSSLPPSAAYWSFTPVVISAVYLRSIPPYRMLALVWPVALLIMFCSVQQMLRTVVIGNKSYSKRFWHRKNIWDDLSIQVVSKDSKYSGKSNTKELIMWAFIRGKAIFIFYLSFSHQLLN